MTQPLMAGKRGLIMGVANDHSIAWGIAQMLAQHGAELAFSYQSEALERRVRPLAESIGASFLIECAVDQDASIQALFETIRQRWGALDFVVHAIAYSDREELRGAYLSTTRTNFRQTLDISCFSFTKVCAEAQSLMTHGGSLLTLTYLGATRVMPHYNVMGVAKAALEASVRYLAADLGPQNIRVNGLSAGPVKTLASAGIGDFRLILDWNKQNAPLRRNTTLSDVGGSALFLLSPLGAGITGEILHVDSGYHIVGMGAPETIKGII
ncbi:MAG: SDR family oxidoreductase [Holosporales bacterium]|jgi:enoyl-[acyl-carrier protein] reductase I|nr:SDR family oxidoreductase [Holosporales bacterium]